MVRIKLTETGNNGFFNVLIPLWLVGGIIQMVHCIDCEHIYRYVCVVIVEIAIMVIMCGTLKPSSK